MKKILYVIIALAVLYFVLALFGPSKVVVERDININKPASVVREKLTDYKFFHDSWSPWTAKDPTMAVTYEGTPGQVGHFYTWKGNKDVREGSMKVIAIKEDTVKWELAFGNSKSPNAIVNLITKEKDGVTNVKWQMVMEIGFMGRTPMLFMNMDKMMAPDFESGLAHLKTSVEALSNSTSAYEVKETEWPETYYVGSKTETVEFMKMGEFFGKNFQAISAELEKNKIRPVAPPMALYAGYDLPKMRADVAAVFKTEKEVALKGWESYKLKPSKVLHVAYYGDYMKMQGAYNAIDKYAMDKGYTKNMTIEEYVTDPMSEKDTAKWMTNIYCILK